MTGEDLAYMKEEIQSERNKRKPAMLPITGRQQASGRAGNFAGNSAAGLGHSHALHRAQQA